MPKRIQEDHKQFRDVVSGRTRRELKRLIKSGQIVRQRGKGGKLSITIPRIDIPHIVFGDTGDGIGRGEGKDGDVIGKDPQDGDGEGGNQAGSDHSDGIQITVDMADILQFLQNELKLPNMKPKPSEIFEEVKIRYNDISKTGPESLRHTRRTMIEAMKRLAAIGELDKLHKVPGFATEIPLIMPINQDKRYRQYTEERIPTSNAVIFFARDCSGSMGDYKCDVVSDMAWWIECWIRKFYNRVDRCYFIHDTTAEEVDEDTFYNYRYGGGTMCSSAFKAIAKQLENRYPPERFNIYIFYFSDGDNWSGDNEKIGKVIKESLPSEIVNMIGVTQILSWRYQDSVKQYVDEQISGGKLDGKYIRTISIGPESSPDNVFSWNAPQIDEKERNKQIIDAIRYLLKDPDEVLL